MKHEPILVLAACAAAMGAAIRAQVGAPPQKPQQQAPSGRTAAPAPPPAPASQQAPDGSYVYDAVSMDSIDRDDYRELLLLGGFRFVAPGLQLDVRGTNALVLADLEASRAAIARTSVSGLPRRGVPPPSPRRRLSAEEVRNRLERTLRAVGRSDALPANRSADQAIDLLRYLYCEGGVTVVREGVEVLRCDRMWVSPLDDRIVVENAELRYVTPGADASKLLVVRGSKLVKEGGRWTGRDLTITTCTAAEPHVALAVGEAEIIEREGEFEVVVRGQTLQIGGTSILPLPDARIFTGSQSEFPVKRAGASYSQKEGVKGGVLLGLPWNQTGGGIHEWLTGRPAHEFRGEWELGVGWIETRGVPLEGEVSYRAEGLYEGRTRGFWLDDRGENLREIQTDFAGNPIDNEQRSLVSTENRLHLGPSTHLDLVAFHAADPAVYSEFYGGDYRNSELPETSAYLHHADGNRLLTVGTRWNLDEFSYRDDRALAERFVEEEPVITYHWIAQPIGETPWGTPIVVDTATEFGQRRSDYDDLATTRVSDRTFRADQLIELSAPFHLGALNLRPFVAGQGTWYDNTVDGETEGRIAVEGGLQVGTRLSRTWSWVDEDGAQGVRHVVAPKLTYRNRFHVDDDASEFFAFDSVDALAEQELVRFEVRNLLQRMESTAGVSEPRDFVLFDLAQDFWPDAERDNAGETVGLLYYDLLIRPRLRWLAVDTLAYAIYGDYDWQDGMRTLDTELQVGPIAGITWTADYREDQVVEGAVGLAASTRLLDRWRLVGSTQRDLQRDEWLNYGFALVRDDHDWSISMSFSYDPFTDETSLRVEFLPRLGGLNRDRLDRFGSGILQPQDFATAY